MMKGYFADCLRNRFEVECIIKDEIDLDQSRNSNTYTSAVLIFASEKHATCALKLNGITFLQKKLKIGRKQPSTYVDWINTGYSNKWDNLVPDWQVEGTIAEDPWREDHKTINYYSTLSVADATEETSSVFGSTEDKHPEESIVVDDRLVEYKSSLSCKFNAALKDENDNELDNEKNDTLFDEMEQEMRSCMEQEMGLLLEQEVVESQRGVINEDEQGNEPTYGITKSIWSEESLHNWGKIGNGERTSSRDPIDMVHPKEDQLPSIKNTSAWFDIHQFKGWESPDEGETKLSTDKPIQEDHSIVSTASRESLESPRTDSAGEVVQILTIPDTTDYNNEIKEDDMESTALVSLGSKSLAANNNSNKNKVVSIDQSLKRVKRQKQRNTLIKCTLKQLRVKPEVLNDGKATALRVQVHWGMNIIHVTVIMAKVDVARKAAALADSKLESIMWHLDKRGL